MEAGAGRTCSEGTTHRALRQGPVRGRFQLSRRAAIGGRHARPLPDRHAAARDRPGAWPRERASTTSGRDPSPVPDRSRSLRGRRRAQHAQPDSRDGVLLVQWCGLPRRAGDPGSAAPGGGLGPQRPRLPRLHADDPTGKRPAAGACLCPRRRGGAAQVQPVPVDVPEPSRPCHALVRQARRGAVGRRLSRRVRELPAVDQYALDVEAQARFLAAQPEVDPARIGIAGASQAGWIMPLAASRGPRSVS